MKNSTKRILCVLLAGTIACGAWSCGDAEKASIKPMEAEEVNTLTFDAIGGEDVMPIAGYYGPMNSTYSYDGEKIPNQITDEYFQMIADSGINLLNQSYVDYKVTPDNVNKLLDLGEKYGIGICVYDTEVTKALGENALPLATLAERINAYANHPAFTGLYVVDEPQWIRYKLLDGNKTIDMFAPIFKNLSELGVYGYGNAFPNHGDPSQDYTDYLTYFVESGNLPYLSYDTYIWEGGHTFENYFYNMSLAREIAFDHDIPFWTFVQAGSQWNDKMQWFDSETPYTPNESQTQWAVNTCLAYGAQGIQYFVLFQPYYYAWSETEPFDFERNGMIGAWGNKNQWYYYIQTINKQIAAVDEVLMNAVNKGVIASGKQAIVDSKLSTCMIEGESWRELQSVDGDAIVGCFNYNGKTALYVVNYDYENQQNITLNFQGKENVTVINNAETSHLSGKSITLNMGAGRGALVVFD